MCACGQNNAYIKGYCMDCVKKLRDKFDSLCKKYGELKEEMELFNPVDIEKSDAKLRAMRTKLERYQIKLTDAQMLDVMDCHITMAGGQERKDL